MLGDWCAFLASERAIATRCLIALDFVNGWDEYVFPLTAFLTLNPPGTLEIWYGMFIIG